MSGGRVVAVVVTWNRKALLMECLACLRAQTWQDMGILVVDNASTDGTGEALAPMAASGEITCFNTGKNLGGAGGFHWGVKKAVEAGYDYVWLMDDDSMPEPSALEALMKAGDRLGNYGWLSGRALWTDGSVCRMNVQRDLKMGNLTELSGDAVPSGAATFVSLLVPARVVREIGLPIKEFFIWADDLEYTRRISRKYPCYAVADSTVVHLSKSNIGANIATESADRLDRFDYLYRNDVYLYRREGLRGFAYEAVRLSGHCLRVLLKAKDHKRERLRKIIGGTRNGFSFHPPVEKLSEEKDP